MPIARSIPSSRVRSWIESASVLAIPNRETRTARREQHVEQRDERVDLVFAAFLQFLLVEHFGGREGRLGAFVEQRLDLLGVGARRGEDEVEEVLGLAEVAGEDRLGDEDAAEDVELRVEFADDPELGPAPGLGEQAEAVAEVEAVRGGEAVGDDRLARRAGCAGSPARPASIRSRSASSMFGVGAPTSAVEPPPTSLARAERIVATDSTPGTSLGRRRRPRRDRREAVGVLDHDPAGEVFVDDLGDRALQAGGEDGDEGDQGEADHQRRRGDRGAARDCAGRSRARAGR